ncbi:hypothetical protein ABZ891_37265 [Streptomyces sp. NPDC047023]|uniref:hypothetical protein n=1 Tax=Streptomyces sp. NPDC047023 TaxID=3155139 RepID=UPI0033FD95D2
MGEFTVGNESVRHGRALQRVGDRPEIRVTRTCGKKVVPDPGEAAAVVDQTRIGCQQLTLTPGKSLRERGRACEALPSG